MARKQQTHLDAPQNTKLPWPWPQRYVCVSVHSVPQPLAASVKTINNRLQEATVSLTAANETSVGLFVLVGIFTLK